MTRFSLRVELPLARHVVRDPLSDLAGVVEIVTTPRNSSLATSTGSAPQSPGGAVENVFFLITFHAKSVTLVQTVSLR